MQQIIMEANQEGQRLDKFLHKVLPEASTSFLCKMMRKKNITINDKKVEGKYILQPKDSLKIFLADDTFVKFGGRLQGESMDLPDITEYQRAYEKFQEIEIVYEDHQILVCNKPSGVLSQKASPEDLSLNEWFLGYLLKQGELKAKDLILFKPSICNRLDRNTSGLLLCAKSLKASQVLNRLIKEKEIRKFYRLFCLGGVENALSLKGYLKKDEKTNKVSVSIQETPGSSYIETLFSPLKVGKELSYLEVELITGKTHQIRAHLASIGHPLLGDYKYGSKKINDKYKKTLGIEDQLLHAYRLEFPEMEEEFKTLSRKVLICKEPAIFNTLLREYI